jgi:hypothetical protein
MNYTKRPSKEFAQVIAATFPEYRKKTVFIGARETVRLSGLNWSGGSRSIYRACTLDGRKSGNPQVNTSGPAPWNNPYEGLEIPVPENWVIVQGGCFCGKDATLFISCNLSNMPQLLTETTPSA